MKLLKRYPDVNKASAYAIVVNAIQIAALIVFVLYMILESGYSDGMLVLIVVVIALMAIWGASIDIYSALQTRRRVRTIYELQTTNDQMDTLNLELRAQRHDFLNHIQVVYSLLEMGESEEAADYLERVYSQLRTVSKVMRTGVTAFNALLQVKNAACEERGIHLELDIRTALEGLPVPPWEICCIIGNLMDNAMDAIGEQKNGWIRLEVRETLRQFTFSITNNGPAVPQELRESIFEEGFSTKGEDRGMGLSIVRKTLAEFGGMIALEEGNETCFTVTVPRESRSLPETIQE